MECRRPLQKVSANRKRLGTACVVHRQCSFLLWGLPLCSRDTTRATLPTSTEDARAITMAGGSWCNVGARNAASCCNCLAVSKTTSFNCRVALWMTCDHVYADRDSEFFD